MLQFVARYPKSIARFYITVMYLQLLIPVSGAHAESSSISYHAASPVWSGKAIAGPVAAVPAGPVTSAPRKATDYSIGIETDKEAPEKTDPTFTGGPTQPEMSSFQSVNGNNMVDLFTGDFSYNIPLMDVGGYPVNIAYRGGISMDQEASWVGLGWNVNPGTITRNMRGLPDDFDGKNDSVRKINNMRENKTIGVTAGADVEIVGLPIGVGASLGVFLNNYKGWGLESGVNVSLNSGQSAKGPLSGGLSITNNSQEGLTIAPSFSVRSKLYEEDDKSASGTGTFSVSLPYNSRSGVKGLQLSAGVRQYTADTKNQKDGGTNSGSFSSVISFASPSYTPTISIPYTSRQFSFTGKVGMALKVFHPSFSISGYVAKQGIDKEDTLLALPSYGYLHFYEGSQNGNALLDFNREKEIPYREKPAIHHIAVPGYTYDAFSITGEGTGGMFRAYRGDIGFVFDHYMRTKDQSDRLSVDVGVTDLVHAGVDLNINRAYSQSGPWQEMNMVKNSIQFKKNNATDEAVYFRNPGEKAINSKQFYDAVGGDDVVTVGLAQPAGPGTSTIYATNYLTRFRNKQSVGQLLLNPQNAFKKERDKRTQVISCLTAKEADVAGLSKYIESYAVNQFNLASCSSNNLDNVEGTGIGLPAEYFPKMNLRGIPQRRTDAAINFDWGKNTAPIGGIGTDRYSIRWNGRIKAPVTGEYTFTTINDDGIRVWLNDVLLINNWRDQGTNNNGNSNATVNLVAGEFYRIRIEYYENKGYSIAKLQWTYPGQAKIIIPQTALYPMGLDTFKINSYLVKEKRINRFRKENHISQISVLNNDGRRYVYGIPVYNLKQRDVTFAVNSGGGNRLTGLVKYAHGSDNTSNNKNGKDWYYNSEEMPAYAHSFLLTGIVSPDYTDMTGNGISDDDPGDAVKFNYSKVCGIANPYRWRAPYVQDSVTFNEGLRTYTRDDKGSYVYGEKELWYLHSIESKTMVATFTVENRLDLMAIGEAGNKYNEGSAKRLKEINLYSKADFIKNPATAVPIKTVHFEYSYELCKGVNKPVTDSGKLTLKKIWFTYNGNEKGKLNPYVFHYSNTNPSYNIKAYDRWGNYKDALQNPGSVSGNIIGNDECPYALQDSSVAAVNTTAWTLDSVYLPSGGALKIDMESDEYAYVQNRRAMQLFKILGLAAGPGLSSGYSNALYSGSTENLYVYVSVPDAVLSKQDVYRKYLAGISKLYFRLYVRMPDDRYGSGYEYVTGYANIDVDSYGRVNNNTIYIKLSGVSLAGDGGGSYNPMAKAAIQFLRLNLPGKAYPGSEVGEDIDLAGAVKVIASMSTNIINAFSSFDRIARGSGWCSLIDLNRSYIRMNDPDYRKFGGGHRVKRITIYDNWDKMTNQRPAIYGQEYTYTTSKEINGVQTTISSGVASYEPGIGNDENPFHEPIEYTEKTGILGPVTLGYTEEPLGESFFPSAGVGYSKVRVRTINYKEKKSANGYAESQFYTAYDFPVFTDRSMIDGDTKKRYKPGLANFLRINAKHHLVLSQGFKIELNDMHGKLRSEATFSEINPKDYVTYTEHFYKVQDPSADAKRLSNNVMVINAAGKIDSGGIIGKDVELMADMREQLSVTNGYNVSLNSELFSIPWPAPPFFLIPTFLNLAQREENLFRSVATLKVIQRYGILDSMVSIDKGSRVIARNILYDSETGDVILQRTQNEFNDPLYQFTYPSHWAYDGMGLAYKNIDAIFEHVTIKDGRIIAGLSAIDTTYFTGGDELLVGGKVQTGAASGCTVPFSTFPTSTKIWCVDTSVLGNGPKTLYFIDRDGKAYNGYDVTLKVIRSGRRNQLSSVGSVTALVNPLVKNTQTGNYELVMNTATKVINTAATEFKQYWKVTERDKQGAVSACLNNEGNCKCLRLFFDYIFKFYPTALYYKRTDNVLVRTLVLYADSYYRDQYKNDNIDLCECSILNNNLTGLFYSYGNDSYNAIVNAQVPYVRVRVGKCVVKITFNFNNRLITGLSSKSCEDGKINYTLGTSDCTTYMAHYFGSGNQLHYTTCSGDTTTITLPATDTLYRFCNMGGWPTITFCNGCYIQKSIDQGCSNPDGRPTDAVLSIESCEAGSGCDNVSSLICYNSLTDSTINPYLYGLLGNWRSSRGYVYYGSRAEEDPTTATTNIRTYGAFADFVPFWQFNTKGIVPKYDTTRWVWNSEITMFNSKGLEIENKDPLGRFNAGLYGYNYTLPTAIAQNARYREIAFEGFEDYGYTTQVCDTACPAQRHVDFSPYVTQFDTLYRHSGKRSLRLVSQQQVGVTFNLATATTDTSSMPLTFTTIANACSSAGNVLKSIQTSAAMVIPTFSPSNGQRMVVSAWVKEDQDCKCTSYTNNRIVVIFNGSSAQPVTFAPSGSIIEGWQRYEGVFDIPLDATSITVSMQSTGSPTVYFDDLRLHPFNANLKSFVFHPVNLRMMAEMDENNYATFYEYDDDGTLIRVKKETQRGIKTIQETRSALLKE